MKVRLTTYRIGPNVEQRPGQVIDVPEAEALHLIEKGHAVLVSAGESGLHNTETTSAEPEGRETHNLKPERGKPRKKK